MANADIILKNASVITMEPSSPAASAIAIKGDCILAIGDREAVKALAGRDTRIINSQGKTVIPGFIDAHCHLFSFIRMLLGLDLSRSAVRSITDIKAVVKKRAEDTPHGTWISGTGLSDYYLAEKRLPVCRELDEISPHHPVVLAHIGLHQAVLNSLALKLAGITKNSPVPDGALVEKDTATGEPTGRVHELLGYIREQVMPPLSENELNAGMALVSRHYLSQGITSIQEATVVNNLNRWEVLRHFKDNGILVPRVYMMFGQGYLDEFKDAGLPFGSGSSHLKLGGVKIIVTESTGKVYPAQEALDEMVSRAEEAGFPVALHAIQEKCIAAAITALEHTSGHNQRHRIEHCIECPPDILDRLRQLKPLIVTQPPFLYYGGDRFLAVTPESRKPWLYRFKSLYDNLTLAGSSDSPVTPNNPLMGIYAAMTRKTQGGQAILPEEALSAAEGLKMYTVNAARASFDEDIKGSLAPGKLADMAVLSGNPLTASPDEFKEIKVVMTIAGGKVVYEA